MIGQCCSGGRENRVLLIPARDFVLLRDGLKRRVIRVQHNLLWFRVLISKFSSHD